MTKSQKADQLQINSLGENALPPTDSTKRPDPRVEAFLERLRTKAEALDTVQRENHVTAKEPRRRPIVEQAANPDWYQPTPAKKAVQPVAFVKRFVGAPRRKSNPE